MKSAKVLIAFLIPVLLTIFLPTKIQGQGLRSCPSNGFSNCRSIPLSGGFQCEQKASETSTPFTLWCCDPGEVINDDQTGCIDGTLQNPVEALDNETFDYFNPLKRYADAEVADQLSTPGGIISRVLVFAFPLAGIILFVMLTWAGFEIVAGGGSKKAQDAGKQRATAAVIGFVLLFVSYWIIQIVEAVFNVAIL